MLRLTEVQRDCALLSVALLGLSFCAGCTEAAARTNDLDLTSPSGPIVQPTFSGTHADLFSELFNAGNDWVRVALSDEIVSEAEWQESQDRLVECAAGLGITISDFQPLGGFLIDWGNSFSASEESGFNTIQECAEYSGYNAMEVARAAAIRLPSGESEGAAMAECLVRAGVAPEGFTESEYVAEWDMTQGVGLAFASRDPRTLQCLDNPTTAFR